MLHWLALPLASHLCGEDWLLLGNMLCCSSGLALPLGTLLSQYPSQSQDASYMHLDFSSFSERCLDHCTSVALAGLPLSGLDVCAFLLTLSLIFVKLKGVSKRIIHYQSALILMICFYAQCIFSAFSQLSERTQ